jgi:GMP synthase (glutamine-hydrolysing)
VTPPRVLVVRNAETDPLGTLADWWSEAGLELDVRPGDALPETLAGFAGLVVLGGPMGATDDLAAPWLPQVRARLREAVSDDVPTLAICLGAQLLAVANGGRVAPNPDGPELGAQLIAKRSAAAGDPLFGPLPITPDVVQWHYDAVTTLPAGAIQLASSPVCEQQAFRVGRLAWGIQFHIETTPDVVRTWARLDAARLADYDLDAMVRRVDAIQDDLAEVWRPFAQAFAGVVLDPSTVPAPRGRPSSAAAPLTDPAAIRAALAAEAQAARGILPMPTRRPPADD